MKKSYVAVQYTGDAKDTMKLKKKVYLFKISRDGEKTRTSSLVFLIPDPDLASTPTLSARWTLRASERWIPQGHKTML